MKNSYLKTLGLVLAVLIGASIAGTLMPVAVAASPSMPVAQDEGVNKTSNKPWWARLNLTFEQAVELALIVRNETYPLFMWANDYLSQYNITIAEKLLARGDLFLERAYNVSKTNETLATAYAFLAAVYYGRAPVTAYIVLGKTISEKLGVNRTPTNETVLAVVKKATELKSLLDNATKKAQEYNITVPDVVFLIEANGVAQLNLSQQLLDKGYVGPALAAAIRGYHSFVRAYNILVKATFAEKLGINLTKVHRISHAIRMQRVNIEKRIQKVLERLPEHVREKIMKHWMEKRKLGPEAIREAIRSVVSEYMSRLKNMSIKQATRIVIGILMITMARDPTGAGRAILQWMTAKNMTITIGGGRLVRPNITKLYEYIENVVNNTAIQYNVTGLLLINKTLEILSQDITITTGIEVNLVNTFYTLIVIHISASHRHGHHGHHGSP